MFMRAKQWERAEELFRAVPMQELRDEYLEELGVAVAQVEQWEYAEEIIHAIVGHIGKIRALCRLGEIYAQKQQWERAKMTWKRAHEMVHFSTQFPDQSLDIPLYELSVSLASAQLWKQAEKVLEWAEKRAYSDEGYSSPTIEKLIFVLALAQQRERVEKIIHSPHRWVRARWEQRWRGIGPWEWNELGVLLAQIHQWSRADKIVGSRMDRSEECELAIALVQAHQWDRAEEVINSIQSVSDQAEALCWLGSELANTQDLQRAKRIWERAEKKIFAITYPISRHELLCELGKVLVQSKQWKWAERIWTRIEESIRSLPDSHQQVQAWVQLGKTLVTLQQSNRAISVWEQAEQAVLSINMVKPFFSYDTVSLDGVLKSVYGEQGLPVTGEYDEQREEQEKIEPPTLEEYAITLSELGEVLTQAERWEQAERILQLAKGVMAYINDMVEPSRSWIGNRHITDVVRLTEARGTLVKALMLAQHLEDAKQMCQQIDDEIQACHPTQGQAKAWIIWGKILAQMQQWERAVQTINQASEALSEDKYEKIKALMEIRDQLAFKGEYERLLRIVQHAWLQIVKREQAIEYLFFGMGLIQIQPAIGIAFYDAFAWVDLILKDGSTD
jgi:tetratricopeptide (TPR) repeat protein